MKKHYRYLLIDFDNTLFDFDRAEEAAFHAAFAASGLVSDSGTYRLYHEINDGLWKKLEKGEITRERLKVHRFELLLAVLQAEIPKSLSHELSDSYLHQLSEQNFLIPGADAVCRQLSRDYQLYIITNGSSSVQMKHYHACGLAPYFDGIFISEMLGVAKPSAAYFDAVKAKSERMTRPVIW